MSRVSEGRISALSYLVLAELRVLLKGASAFWYLVALAFETSGFVAILGVLRNRRGRGIGTALLHRSFAELARLGQPEVRLTVDALNTQKNIAQQIVKKLVNWRDLLAAGEGRSDDLEVSIARLKRADTCCFIYTSGTGGTPNEVFLSFLPLSHAYEHTVGQFFPMTIAAQIYYAESVEKLTENMVEVRPTIMTAVPRLYEARYQRIQRSIAKATPLQRRLFQLALE